MILCILLYLLIPLARTCILLLNGWEPIPAIERAKLADIVLSARAIKTYKDDREPQTETYTAVFRVKQVLKGIKALEKVPAVNSTEFRTDVYDYHNLYYNVSNFGDKAMCYADIESGKEYILFLTVFGEQLSAKYDDLFGAVAEYTLQNEDLILKSFGWRSWGDWQPCSASCDTGTQLRHRQCNNKLGCGDGAPAEKRLCNFFHCQKITDILSMIRNYHQTTLPQGVHIVTSRPSAFHLKATSSVYLPLHNLFPAGFPMEFSILTTIKPKTKQKGYILTIADLLGLILFGIQIEGDKVKITYNPEHANSKYGIQTFSTSMRENKWTFIGIGVTQDYIYLYIDCAYVGKQKWRDGSMNDLPIQEERQINRLGQDSIISIGRMFFGAADYAGFHGEIDQLVLVPGSETASQQCEQNSTHVMTETESNDSNGVITPIDDLLGPTSTTIEVELSWSGWSSCSVTCGRGSHSRTAYCPDVTLERCYELAKGAVQTKTCQQPTCKAGKQCKRRCYNNGECAGKNRCKCKPGYYGRNCQKVECYPQCENSGRCLKPNKCVCPRGWGGKYCHRAKCYDECANGGSCIYPGVCACPLGYLPPNCRAYCSTPCYNGGTCIGFNMCKCVSGYAGNLCQNAICEHGCSRTGQCIAPNTCLCESGWAGKHCTKPLCSPGCQNGGTCLLPYFCVCPYGTYGTFCEQYLCNPGCLNGGSCIGHNLCGCTEGYTGKYCENKNCAFGGCYNGGECHGNMCTCRDGFYGNRCENRLCQYRVQQLPMYVRFTQPVFYTEKFVCGAWGQPLCTRTRLVYKDVYRKEQRQVYRCV